MTRTAAREIAVHLIFEMGFGNRTAQTVLEDTLNPEVFQSLAEEAPLYAEFPDETQLAYIRQVVTGVEEHRQELDESIEKYAIGWRLSRIPRMAVAAMRCAMYEMKYMPDVPVAAAIDAEVDLLRRYVDPDVVSFVNGILGSYARSDLPGGEEADTGETAE